MNIPNKLASAKLKPGESIKWTNDDGVVLVKWRDRRDVYMIGVNDEGLDVVRQVRRNNMPCDMLTPCCVRKYNSLMSGVDRMDQLRSYYSLGRAGRRWWKYIFNAYILWKKMNHPLHANSRVSSLKTWKMRLIHNMVDDYVPQSQQSCEPAVDNLSVERGLCRLRSGTPASPVLGPKENMQTMYPHSLSKQNAM